MIVNIKCSACSELLGTIEKSIVTQEDIDKYREMVTCSQGHGLEDISLEEVEPE